MDTGPIFKVVLTGAPGGGKSSATRYVGPRSSCILCFPSSGQPLDKADRIERCCASSHAVTCVLDFIFCCCVVSSDMCSEDHDILTAKGTKIKYGATIPTIYMVNVGEGAQCYDVSMIEHVSGSITIGENLELEKLDAAALETYKHSN